MKHIVFISSNYPSSSRPFNGTFVRQLVLAFARLGIKCTVISPVSIFHRRYGKFDPEKSLDFTINENPVTVLRPRYVSFSSRNIFSFNTAHLTQISFEKAVSKIMSYLDTTPTILYGHFLYQGGAAAVHMASKTGIPSIVAVGESSYWSIEPIGFQKAIQDFKNVNGIVAVSSVIRKSLIEKLKIPEEKIVVLPNGIDLSLFYYRSRKELRKKFGFPDDKFIIAFIGHFDERKGPHRILSAVSGMDNIGLIFIGNGPIPLKDKKILFKGVLEHNEVPEMLSAADIFVLPTLMEGSCNAILEALACGLPVVTSKGKFNDDIVDDTVAIRVDPLNINEIRDAIIRLIKDNNLRNEMSINALKKSKQFDINIRAKRMLEWIKMIQNK
jgi:glycosyltransferase involved in cell wall biosynthesis